MNGEDGSIEISRRYYMLSRAYFEIDIAPEHSRNVSAVREFHKIGREIGVLFHYVPISVMVPQSGLNGGNRGWIMVVQPVEGEHRETPENGSSERHIERPAL